MCGQDGDAGDEDAGDHAEEYRQQERNRSPKPSPHRLLLMRLLPELIRKRGVPLHGEVWQYRVAS
jgi:hypothetical protein